MATDEASLLAALMRGEPVTLERGTVIRLTRTLLIKEKPSDYDRRQNYHCECTRLRPRRERKVRGRRLRGGRRREG